MGFQGIVQWDSKEFLYHVLKFASRYAFKYRASTSYLEVPWWYSVSLCACALVLAEVWVVYWKPVRSWKTG